MRTLPSISTPVGMGVVKDRPWGPKIISIKARKAIDKAMVSMMTDSMGRPSKGWISAIWIKTPNKAAAPTMKTMAKGKGSCKIEMAVTAK